MARASKPPVVPEAEQVFLDHAGVFVPDLAPVAGALSRLGFTLTPLARHGNAPTADGPPAPSGTANICAMFRAGYFEVVGSTGEDTPLARQLADRLKRHPGLHLIAFAVAESPAHRARLEGAGFDPVSLVRLRRAVPTPDSEANARFDVLRVPPETMPEGRIQLVSHYTPELVWQPRFLDHENGAQALSGALVCAEDADESRGRFGRLIGRDGRTPTGSLDLDRGRVDFVTPVQLSDAVADATVPALPFIAAAAFAVSEIAATRRLFEDRGVGHREADDGRLIVRGDAAFGASLVFHQHGTDPWP